MFANQYENDNFLKSALAYHGSVTPKVLKKVFYIFIYSSVISYLNYLNPAFYVPIGPFEYAGLMMGLILVFRINSGYDRWWEARKLWGNIVNSTRNLATIISNYVNTPKSSPNNIVHKLNRYVIALAYLIKNRLRGEQSLNELNDLLDTNTLNTIIHSQNRPLVLAGLIAKELNQLRINNELDPMAFLKAEEQREAIIDCLGACERILHTPMPYVMAVKSRRFILIFLLALPLALVNTSNFIAPLITALVAYAIFSIDQIGYELQQPFSLSSLSHLPLDTICNKIKNDIEETCSN